MSVVLWAVLGAFAAAVFLVFVWTQYNRMVGLRNRCTESWSNVDTELLRRHDLIPNLVRTVQGYAAHEKSILQEVTRLRTSAAQARRLDSRFFATETQLAGALNRLFAVAEAYPQLKASRNFLALQHELAITEDRIQAARRFFNANVRDYRDATRQFPGSLVAGLFSFREIPFFEIPNLRFRAAPSVGFTRVLTT